MRMNNATLTHYGISSAPALSLPDIPLHLVTLVTCCWFVVPCVDHTGGDKPSDPCSICPVGTWSPGGGTQGVCVCVNCALVPVALNAFFGVLLADPTAKATNLV